MKNKILNKLIICLVLLQVPLFASGQSHSEPIRKIAVISLVDDTMCVYPTKKGFFSSKELLQKIAFQHSPYLNEVIQRQFSSLLSEKFEVVTIQDWESRVHHSRFPGIKEFWSAQKNCTTVFQMVQESQVDAILFIHPYLERDATRESKAYAPGGAGFIAAAFAQAIKEASKSDYMTAPELGEKYVSLWLNVGLYDVRGWKSGNPKMHPKKIRDKGLYFLSKYRKDRISSTVSPTPHDQMMMCEVIRLSLPRQAAETLSNMKLYSRTK